MRRLIDANELLEHIKILGIITNNNEDIFTDDIRNVILRLIDAQPTAYDVNAVVNTLQQQAVQYHTRAEKYAKAGVNHEVEHMAGKAASYEHAIEIVKGGGVE